MMSLFAVAVLCKFLWKNKKSEFMEFREVM